LSFKVLMGAYGCCRATSGPTSSRERAWLTIVFKAASPRGIVCNTSLEMLSIRGPKMRSRREISRRYSSHGIKDSPRHGRISKQCRSFRLRGELPTTRCVSARLWEPAKSLTIFSAQLTESSSGFHSIFTASSLDHYQFSADVTEAAQQTRPILIGASRYPQRFA